MARGEHTLARLRESVFFCDACKDKNVRKRTVARNFASVRSPLNMAHARERLRILHSGTRGLNSGTEEFTRMAHCGLLPNQKRFVDREPKVNASP